MDQAMLLVQIGRQKRPYTLSKEFSHRLQLAQGSHTAALIKAVGRACSKGSTSWPDEQTITVDPDLVGAASTNQSNVRRTTQEIHDKLRAYYDLALCRFVDNVFQQSVDYCLLTGPPTPLAVFDQDWVIKLEAKKLKAIAGDSKASESRRDILESKARDLTAALDILM